MNSLLANLDRSSELSKLLSLYLPKKKKFKGTNLKIHTELIRLFNQTY